MTSLALSAIEFYQQSISPHKGFRCAHRALHGRSSCSRFAQRVLKRLGTLALPGLLRRRFDKCARAAAKLRDRVRKSDASPAPVLDYASPKRNEEQSRHKHSSSCLDSADCLSCAPDLAGMTCDLGLNALSPADACACDLTP